VKKRKNTNQKALPPRLRNSSTDNNLKTISESPKWDLNESLSKITSTLNQLITVEIEKLGDQLTFVKDIEGKDVKDFEQNCEPFLGLKIEEQYDFRITEDGRMLLAKALAIYTYFKAKEESRLYLCNEEFHLKSLVDDILNRLLIASSKIFDEGNVNGKITEDPFASW